MSARAALAVKSETLDTAGQVSAERLRSFIKRLEKLEEDKAAVSEDIKEVYAEAKGAGYDTKTIRTVIRLMKMDEQKRTEQNELLDLYLSVLGLHV